MRQRFLTLVGVLAFWRKAMKVINCLAATALDLQHPLAAREQLTALCAAQLGELFGLSHDASLFHTTKT
jgi:hypothetical protein